MYSSLVVLSGDRELAVEATGTGAGAGGTVASTLASARRALLVAVNVRTKERPAHGVRGDVLCTAIGQTRQVDITLDAPIGNRVLVDASTKAAVPIIP